MFSFMMTSADGYHADPDQALAWHNVDQEFSQFALAQLREAGTLVFGRVTYEGMAAFWPTPAGEESDPVVAKAMNTTPKIVISQTLPQATWAGTQIISKPRRRGTGQAQAATRQGHRDPGQLNADRQPAADRPARRTADHGEPGHPGPGQILVRGSRQDQTQPAEDPAVHLRQRPALLPAGHELIKHRKS